MEQRAKIGVLRALQNSVRYARAKLGPEIPATTLEVLLIIARNPDISMSEIHSRMDDVSISAISRHVSMLTQWTWDKKQGPGLVDWKEDPYERRRKLCKLTPQGDRFLTEWVEVFNVKAKDDAA
jgi:DNA-binding MarR family transcriptional regulator